LKKYILPLLLAASAGHAAPLDRVFCSPVLPIWNKTELDQARLELDKAQRARDDAQAHPDQPLLVANALSDLAMATTTMSGDPANLTRYSGSGVELIRQARGIWSQAPLDPDLAVQLQERGRRYALKGRCALAQPVLQLSLEIAEKTKGKEARQTLEAVNDMLRVSLALRDSAAVNALAPRLVEDGEDKPWINVDHLYEDLADFYYRGEDYAKAEPLVRKSLELAKSRTSQDPALERRLNFKLASIYYEQLRYAEAEALVAGLKPVFRLPEPEAGRRRTREQMAQMVRAGDMAGALALGERAREQYEADAASSQTVLAEAEATYNSSPKSGPVWNKAVMELRTAAARANSDMQHAAKMLGYLGEIHHARNELAQAEKLYLQAQERFARVKGGLSLDATRTETDLAILYRMRGEPERALPLQEEALKAMLPLLGSEHPDVLETQDELALIYKALKRYGDAEPLYAARLAHAERRGAGPQEMAEELDALAEIATAQGDSAKAASYAQRAKLYRDSVQADKPSPLNKRAAPPARKKKG
jgi:tetratricopeptide (TPR) repeat protein